MNEKRRVELWGTGFQVCTVCVDEVPCRGAFPVRWATKMRAQLALPAVAMLIFVTAGFAKPTKTAVSSDGISVFKVPLVCPAAPSIGCGSRAKPVLLKLEKQDAIAGAWLNREGTLLAIVWKPEANRKTRKATLAAVLKDQGIEVRELGSGDRKAALAGFPSSKEWLRGSDVDRLSEEEAGIMAARLVRKIKTIISVDDAKALTIERQSAEILKRHLTGELPEGTSPREEVLKVLRENLNAKDVAVLQEQLKDYRPGSDQP